MSESIRREAQHEPSDRQTNSPDVSQEQSRGNAAPDSGRNGRANSAGQQHAPTARSRRRRFTKSIRMGLLVAAALVFVAGFGIASFATSVPAVDVDQQSRALAVQTVFVEPVTSYQARREYTGAIVARRTSELGFELAGKLTELRVNEGARVTDGAVLALLDTEHLRIKRRQVAARRARAAAQMDEMVAGPRAEEIAAARARVASLRAQVELLKRQAARYKKLLASNATPQDEYDQYAFGLKAREAQLGEALHNLEELQNGTRNERIEAQRAVVAELDAALADIEVDLNKSKLAAPFDGTIARRLADEGTVVETGQPVYRLVEDEALEAWIGLPAHAAGRLSKGSMQRVRIQGERMDAIVAGLFPEVDPATRTRTIVLRLDEAAAEHVVHGQVVRLELEETVQVNGFWLPMTSLTKGSRGLWTVLVVEAKVGASDSIPSGALRVESRELEVLHTQSDRVLVRGTLNPGDRVIARGTHRVVPGQLVRVSS